MYTAVVYSCTHSVQLYTAVVAKFSTVKKAKAREEARSRRKIRFIPLAFEISGGVARR